MKQMKPFLALEFRDAFMFAAVMEDEDICKSVLERILGIPIKSVNVHTESMILVNPEHRGIRMDVFADDEEGTVFDVEMQTTDRGNLPCRSRCYQGQMDVAALEPGDDFNKLPRSFIIFICTFDPFGRGLYRYTYEPTCKEDGIALDDGTCRIFLNTHGTNPEDVPPELVTFLRFVENSEQPSEDAPDTMLDMLRSRIAYLKHSRRLEERYMLFGEMLDDERKLGKEEGRVEGRVEGQAQILSLISALQADGKSEEISRLLAEPEALEKLLEDYHITTN